MTHNTITVTRPGHPTRQEPILPGSGFLTPTGLMHDLLDWLDHGHTWDDLDPGVRQLIAGDLRSLADIVEGPDAPPPTEPDTSDSHSLDGQEDGATVDSDTGDQGHRCPGGGNPDERSDQVNIHSHQAVEDMFYPAPTGRVRCRECGYLDTAEADKCANCHEPLPIR